MSISASVREACERRWRHSEEIQDRIAAAIDNLPVEQLRELARLYVGEVGYLGEHFPEEREDVAPFACSGKTYHYCSFSAVHDPGCPAVGGDGNLTRPKNATPCAPDCGETDARPWCQFAGFDCETCAMVDRLLGILEASGA